MTGVLIHSMSEFSDIIFGALEIAGAKEIVEIGAEFGGMSSRLAGFAAEHGGRLTSIDPAPKQEFLDWVAENPHVRHIAKLSLEALPDAKGVDAWLIDGDHNWYTVYHELKCIEASCRRDGKPFLAFLHDIDWPAARRDMYYAPDQIPAEYRQPYDYYGGAVPGYGGLLPGRGFGGVGQWAFAVAEGGPRNGVLTAVEDFTEELSEQGRTMAFCQVPAVFGLGILFDMDAEWSQALAESVLPYHDNSLLRSLEQNRLANFIAAIDS
jgi:predicted O-methyltransferase YrrM